MEQQQPFRSSSPPPYSTSTSSTMENEVYIDGKLPVDDQVGYQGRYSIKDNERGRNKKNNVCTQLFRLIRSKIWPVEEHHR